MTKRAEQPEPLAVPVKEVNWPLRIVLAVIVVVALVVAYLIGVTVLPRWWSHRVGNRVDGSITAGVWYGLLLGFVFTLFPLVVLRQAFRRTKAWVRIAVVLLALALAVPNLLTLSIVLGDGTAAHAGDRVLDVEAPGFRLGSSIGAVAAVVVGVLLLVTAWRRRHDRRKLEKLKVENKAAQQTLSERAPRDASSEGDAPQR
ncbi:MAG: hypothetical protein QM655_12820 [Nocardioidaceae bacterium]